MKDKKKLTILKKSLTIAMASTALIFCLSFIVFKNRDIISWDKNYKISWNDFKGQPQSSVSSKEIASSVGIYYSMETKMRNVEFIVVAQFDKKKSWYKPEGKTELFLKHEQGHFDLTEIFARKLRKTLKDKKIKKENAKEAARRLYKANEVDYWEQQEQYDKETENSKIESRQEMWEDKIKDQLEDLEDYADTLLLKELK